MESNSLWVLLVVLAVANLGGCSRVSTTVARANGAEVRRETSQNKPSPCIRWENGSSERLKRERRAKNVTVPKTRLQAANEAQPQPERQ
jgi:hypothetical protein